ncbi:hypothetical protein ACIOJD_09040 [Streptomyces sp. NPDC088116]|uniref:hypothetical protein n=1 Tax=Streptomyces sp. NPDC088116 TaxID=3365825 RepID=UPI0038127EA8
MDPGTCGEAVVGECRPPPARPCTYGIRATCENGNEATGDLTMGYAGPRSRMKTGVGGTTASDTTRIAAGTAVTAVPAVGGTRLLRRRASGAQGS